MTGKNNLNHYSHDEYVPQNDKLALDMKESGVKKFFKGLLSTILRTKNDVNLEQDEDTDVKNFEPKTIHTLGYTDVVLSPEVMRNTYDEGMELLFNKVDEIGHQNGFANEIAFDELRKFYKESTDWAELDGTAVRALKNGKRKECYRVVIPANNPLMVNAPASLYVESHQSFMMIVKPIAMTKEWASVFLMHELRHQFDLKRGREPENPNRDEYMKGEVRAFKVELNALDILSDYRYKNGVKEFLEKNELYDLDEIYTFLYENLEHSYSIFEELDILISPEKPASISEAGLRSAMHNTALCFVHIMNDESLNSVMEAEKYREALVNIANIIYSMNSGQKFEILKKEHQE